MVERTFYTIMRSSPGSDGGSPIIVLDIDDLDNEKHKQHVFSPAQVAQLRNHLTRALTEQAEEYGYSLDDPPEFDTRHIRVIVPGVT